MSDVGIKYEPLEPVHDRYESVLEAVFQNMEIGMHNILRQPFLILIDKF